MDDIIAGFDNISEEDILEGYYFLNDKTKQIKDFDGLVKYLRKTPFIEYICYCDYGKAYILLEKIINAFQVGNINIEEKVLFIKENGKKNIQME